MRVRLIAGNWKMNLTRPEAVELAREIRNRVRPRVDGDVALCPSYPFIDVVARALAGSPVQVGAQDLDPEERGARTGAVSGPMLRSVGATFTLVGHSERRAIFGDSEDVVAAKVRAALKSDLRVVLCVGESLQEREASRTFEVVLGQLRSAIEGLGAEELGRITVAYEPVWAIGTGRTASPEQAQEVHRRIRSELASIASRDVAARTRILYGGSVKPTNAAALMAQPDIDGALVGGASLDFQNFIDIIRA